MHRRGSYRRRIEHGRETLARLGAGESHDLVSLRGSRDQRGLDQPLQIHSEIEAFAAEQPPGRQNLAGRAIEGNDLVDERVAFEQRRPARLDDPAQAAVRKAVLEAGDRGQGMDHIPHRAEPHDQDAKHR